MPPRNTQRPVKLVWFSCKFICLTQEEWQQTWGTSLSQQLCQTPGQKIRENCIFVFLVKSDSKYKIFFPSLVWADVEAEGAWQTQTTLANPPVIPAGSLHSQPSRAFLQPSLVQLLLAGKHILTLNRLTPLAKPNSEGFCKLAGKPKNCKDGAKVCLI